MAYKMLKVWFLLLLFFILLFTLMYSFRVTFAEFQNSNNDIGSQNELLSSIGRFIDEQAISEPYIVKVAIAAVFLNRLKQSVSTSEKILNELGLDGKTNKNTGISEESRRAVRDAINGWDPTGGSFSFYNSDNSTNYSCLPTKKIGSYIFCK